MAKNPQSLRRTDDLIAAGLVSAGDRAALEQVAARYAVAITPGLAGCIDPGDPADPVGRQFIPDARELDASEAESADPIADDTHSPLEGIVHRYPDRVLLKLTHVCAVYCRFCFRREMVGPAGRGGLSPPALKAAFDYIRAHPEIWEVILTGGDPLVLSPRRLKAVAAELAAIDHVKIMRVHTRMPVATPERVTPALVRALKASGKALYVVLHVNHARELSPVVRAACARLVDAGIPMLSQSVLLRGVNDDPAALGDLMRTLVEMPHQALLPAPRRPRARHVALARHDRGGQGADARAARTLFGAVPAVLRARHSRRLRQVAGRPMLRDSNRHERQRAIRDRGLSRPPSRLSARYRAGSVIRQATFRRHSRD